MSEISFKLQSHIRYFTKPPRMSQAHFIRDLEKWEILRLHFSLNFLYTLLRLTVVSGCFWVKRVIFYIWLLALVCVSSAVRRHLAGNCCFIVINAGGEARWQKGLDSEGLKCQHTSSLLFFLPSLSCFLLFTSWFFRFLLSSSQKAEVWDIPVVPVIDNGLSSFIISLVVL